MLKVYKTYATRFLRKFRNEDGAWEYIVGVILGLIVAAFILIPQVRTFSSGVMTAMGTWWTNISDDIFKTS